MYKLFTILSLLFMNFTVIAQNKGKAEKAIELTKQAIEKMDGGALEESIELLKNAQKLDKNNLTIQYELAYAYYKNKDYSKAIGLLEEQAKQMTALYRVYALLGNSYGDSGNPDKAFEKYAEGIKRFPDNTGVFYLESGLLEYNRKNYDEA
jgi:tetratricopeptide (TPR) repeat protein